MTHPALQDHKIIIVGGSGGVGKTSASAALGISAAIAGYNTLVLTIDPARRLAGALGLDGIGTEASDVTPRLKEMGLKPKGQLHAMMLDVQNTLDRVVDRYAPDDETKAEILNNRLYQNISTRLSGSQEYASMQRLYEIAEENRFDRIILDTPPSTHALDFLTAPQRLMEFFDSKLIQIFVNFGGRAGRGFFRVTDVLFRALDKLTGATVIREIAEFFTIAETILEPFNTQSDRTEALLRRPDTTFLVVTGANRHQLDDAQDFRDKLQQMQITVRGIIVNRWMKPLLENSELERADDDKKLEQRVQTWGALLEQVAAAQTRAVAELEEKIDIPVARIPEFDGDVHTIDGLLQIVEHIG